MGILEKIMCTTLFIAFVMLMIHFFILTISYLLPLIKNTLKEIIEFKKWFKQNKNK
jgi:hypothetical protein